MMFDLGAIIHSNAARQHMIGNIQQDDLQSVAAGRIPEIVGGWRNEGHQVFFTANFSIDWVVEACEWLNSRNIKFRLGAEWMIERHGTDVGCMLDNYIVSSNQNNSEIISLFQLIFI